MKKPIISILICFSFLLSGCLSSISASRQPEILAMESFLADITQNIAGENHIVGTLIPLGMDPHTYQPTPQDIVKITGAKVIIMNGAGLESFLEPILQNIGSTQVIITASQGLTPLPDPSGEHTQGDPHYWMDPLNVAQYVDNIRDGLSQFFAADASLFSKNADAYKLELASLDTWITSQVQLIPLDRRLLVTNHETLGYFAHRYGFTLVGSILPGVSSGAAPSARDLADLINAIHATGAPAIFLDTGSNTQLADQISSETGIKVVTGLYTHFLSQPGGPAGTYLDMMRYDVSMIVGALK